MIIDITKSGYQKGYLPKVGVGVFHPFFATANAAFRRTALQRTGGFDLNCATGEDIDLSIRVAAAGYELWFEPAAQVTHYHRHSLRGLIRQWFHYGYGHAYLFRKHCQGRRLQVYRYRSATDEKSPLGIARVVDVPFPVYGMICLSEFHLIHLGLLLGGILILAGLTKMACLAFAMALAAAAYYVGVRFDVRRPIKSLIFCAIKYAADWSYVAGGLLGGFRDGVIYLEATKSRRRSSAKAA